MLCRGGGDLRCWIERERSEYRVDVEDGYAAGRCLETRRKASKREKIVGDSSQCIKQARQTSFAGR